MTGKLKLCPGKDSFERMNFLYQAGTLMAGKSNVLSCYYGNICKSIGKKSVLRMQPDLKRTICKRCSLILIPGTSADVEIEEGNRKAIIIICKKCNFSKRFVLNANYKFWLDNPDSVKQILQFGNSNGDNLNIENVNNNNLYRKNTVGNDRLDEVDRCPLVKPKDTKINAVS